MQPTRGIPCCCSISWTYCRSQHDLVQHKLFGGTRNETRITNLGGRNSPLLNRNNTGAVALFFFTGSEGNRECRYWVCRDELEEDTAETFAGPVEPGRLLLWNTAGDAVREAASGRSDADCSLDPQDMPPSWFERFPSPLEIFETALELRPYSNLPPDSRLVRRRNCEYAVFRSVERAAECDVIRRGFDSIDSFIRRAQTILQRRKSRSGRSLELHLKTILSEENVPYAFQPTTETRRKPDFIFPSQEAYDDTSFPASRLKLLAVKTTVRERWRQVLEEASRVSTKHLLTLQEGVSENQFAQMRESGLQLVVPRSLHSKYPPSVVPQLITLQDFVNECVQSDRMLSVDPLRSFSGGSQALHQ